MSTEKRSRRRHRDAQSASPPLPSKRLKTANQSHASPLPALGFLVDQNARSGKTLTGALTNGLPDSQTTRVDASHAVLAANTKDFSDDDGGVGGTQNTAISISSADESSVYSTEEDELDDDEDMVGSEMKDGFVMNVLDSTAMDKGTAEPDADVEMMDEGGEDQEDLSFGDQLRARFPDPIEVEPEHNPTVDPTALVSRVAGRGQVPASGMSLATVLTQALRTNDKDLLESCFHESDVPTIRSTIQRLPSQHVSALLQRLAERIHRRPGRTGNLMVWMQWSLVAHGGYISGQPQLVKTLKSLTHIMRERANGLQPLLRLKGKLEMLRAQLELRQNMQADSRAVHEDEEDDAGVVYVEGAEDDAWSDTDEDDVDDDDDDDDDPAPVDYSKAKQNGRPKQGPPDAQWSDTEGEDDSDIETTDGMLQEAAEDDDDSGTDGSVEGLLDDEAEETSDDGSGDDIADAALGGSDGDWFEGDEDDGDDSDGGAGVLAPKLGSLHRKK